MPAPPTVLLTDCLPLVLPSVRGCPDMVATFHLRQAAIEFCERARAWRHLVTKAITEADNALPIPPYATVHVIEHAHMDGQILDPVAYTDIEPNDLLAEASPRYITQTVDDRLTVIPFAAGDLTVSMFLKPRQGTCPTTDGSTTYDLYDTIPLFLFRQHAATLAKGALASLLNLPGQEWTAHPLAAQARAEFLDRCNSAHAKSVRGQQRAPIRTTTGWF